METKAFPNPNTILTLLLLLLLLTGSHTLFIVQASLELAM